MKAVGIVGYKKSGKTSLILKIAEKMSKNYKVGIIKHAEKFDEKESDTKKFSEKYMTGYVSERKSGIIFPEKKSLEDIISYLNVDILLIEGFKNNRSFPKITCGKYKDDLAIASDKDSIDDIIMKIEKYGFKLPNINCGRCGYTCEKMASRIIKGEASVKDCQMLNETEIKINGRKINLNRFVSNLIKNVIISIIKSLKETEKGAIEIKIKE